jgi:hypothetical protein
MPTRPPLPAAGRALVAAVGVSGLVVAVNAIAVRWGTDIPIGWVAFSLLTFASGLLTLKIPSIDALLSVSEIFAFSCVLLYGPELGALTVTIDALLLSLRRKHGVAFTVFNVGNLTLSVWSSGLLFFMTAGIATLAESNTPVGGLIVPLGVLAVSYFMINSGLTAGIIAAESRQNPLAVWREHFMPLAPTYAAGASVALLLVVALRQVQFSAIALILPLLLISYLTMRSSFGRKRRRDARAHPPRADGGRGTGARARAHR